MNKTIYINNENRENLIKASEKESINSIVNKALKAYFEQSNSKAPNKVKQPKIEVKNPAKDSEQKKDIKQRFKGFRAPSNW